MLWLGVGLIPAYAGRTRNPEYAIQDETAHPRLRGADPGEPDSHELGAGSSPLTRGGRTNPHTLLTRIRLIPAYAGRTHGSSIITQSDWAHPRLRGADYFGVVFRDCKRGLIPAYAGRTP